jgi:hypothetical protein
MGHAPERGLVPAPVRNAVRIMFVRTVLGVGEIVEAVATRSTLKAEILRKNPASDSTRLSRLFNPLFTALVVAFLMYLVVYALLALQVRQGRNWARVVTVVLGALAALFSLASLGETEPAPSHVLGPVNAALSVVVIVLLSLHQSSLYFHRAG